MIWLLYGEEDFLIDQEVKQIVKNINIAPTFFDSDDQIDNIYMEISTISMFYEKKLIVIRNHPILNSDSHAKEFISRLRSNTDSVNIIFVINDKKYPKNSITTFLEKYAKVKLFEKIDQKSVVSAIKEIVKNKGGNINNGAALRLALKTPNNLHIIVQEIDKLLLQNTNITEENVEASIGEYVKDDFFGLTNALIAGENYAILSSYKEKLKNGEEAGQIIGQIASLFSLCLQVMALRSQGMTNQDISDQLKIHIFRVRKSFEMIGHSSIEKIKKLTVELAELEKNIKIGQIDPKIGLDYFILKTLN